jgi:hypothetical protein
VVYLKRYTNDTLSKADMGAKLESEAEAMSNHILQVSQRQQLHSAYAQKAPPLPDIRATIGKPPCPLLSQMQSQAQLPTTGQIQRQIQAQMSATGQFQFLKRSEVDMQTPSTDSKTLAVRWGTRLLSRGESQENLALGTNERALSETIMKPLSAAVPSKEHILRVPTEGL